MVKLGRKGIEMRVCGEIGDWSHQGKDLMGNPMWSMREGNQDARLVIDGTLTGGLLDPYREGVPQNIVLITGREDSDAWQGWWQRRVAVGRAIVREP